MRDRLFSVIDGEPVITAPLVNLRNFRKLWERDKTDDKSIYKKWMAFIYYTCDYRSDFYEMKDKEEKALLDLFDRSDYPVPSRVRECQDEYRKRNTPAEQRALDSAINSAEAINEAAVKMRQDAAQIDTIISQLDEEIDKQTDVLNKIALLNKKMELQEKQLGLVKNTADLIPKIEKAVQSIVNLRAQVETAVMRIQDSKDRVEEFMIDSFIGEVEKGEFTLSE